MGDILNYTEELTKAMFLLSEHEKTLFVGQQVKYDGQAAFKTFFKVPDEKKIEFPVAEEFQMGFCTGLALEGFIPVCFYPRMDFLILAMNQLVNHLDKLPIMGVYPKVIVRVGVGSTKPLNPGPQHTNDYTDELARMLHTVEVVTLNKPSQIVPEYLDALERDGSTLLIEYMEKYQ